MTDGTAGWFRDPNDPALARWHDGERWTEHTLVIADQTPGTEPPPPVIAPTVSTPTFDDTSPYSQWEDSYAEPASNGRGGVPLWAKVVGPIAVIAVAAVAFFFLSSGGDDSSDDETETAGEVATLDDAVEAARRAGLPTTVTDARAAALIERICDTAADPTQADRLGAQMGTLPASDATDLRQTIAALGIGANRRCPDDLDDEPTLIEDLQDAAVVAFSTTTTAPTILPDGATDAGTDAGAIDAGATGGGTGGTGGKGTTNTTKKPGTTVTTAPPATTTTLPTVQAGTSCSTQGARGVSGRPAAGRPMECRPKCTGVGVGQLQWQQPGSCSSVPDTDPNTPIPTTTTTTVPDE